MAGPEVRSGALEKYQNFNKMTLTGELGLAAVAAFVAPPLVGPLLGLAAIDTGQILFIDKIKKKK